MRRLALTLLAAATLTAGACGGSSTSSTTKDPISAAQSGLASIERASLDLRLTAAAGTGADRTGDVGFEVKGPFELPAKAGRLPVAELTSTRLLGKDHQPVEATFVSTGSRAWVRSGSGKPVELTGAQLDGLRGSSGGGDLRTLHLSSWFATRKTATSGSTTTTSGTLDAPAALNDVLGLAGSLGADAGQPPLSAADADHLRALVQSSSVRLVSTGAKHELRSLHFDVQFAPDAAKQAELTRLLPHLAGVSMTFDLRLDDVGKAIHVTAPTGS